MPISFVNAAQASGTTVAIPAHQVGDLIVAWAFRSGSNTAPTVPSGQNWQTPIFQSDGTSANNSAGSVLTFKIAASSSETFGNFSNATQCEVAVYRGADQTSPIGASATATAISAALNYPALTATASGSFIAAVSAHRTSTIVNTPPAGMVNRVNRGSGTAALAIHDTDGPASSFASDTETGSNSSGWRSVVFEIKAAPASGIAAQAAIAEEDDAAASASALVVRATVAKTEAGDSAAATATLSVRGAAGIGEGSDTLSSVAAGVPAANTASAAILEVSDTVAAAATNTAPPGRVAIAIITEDDDIGGGVGRLRVAATATLAEDADLADGAILSLRRAVVAIEDGDDSLSSFGTGARIRTTEWRRAYVPSEDRFAFVSAENRIAYVPAEDRRAFVSAQ